jgi:hypothetical protein
MIYRINHQILKMQDSFDETSNEPTPYASNNGSIPHVTMPNNASMLDGSISYAYNWALNEMAINLLLNHQVINLLNQ